MSFLEDYPQLQIVQSIAKQKKVAAYLVGGFLRDYLLGRPCLDFDFAVKKDAIKWVSAGTLVSVGPDTESTPPPGRVRSAVLGETTFTRTRVETTEGVYIVGDKIGIAEMGIPVRIGFDSSAVSTDAPKYLAIGDTQYEIVR